jgi:hypothetical protein
MSDENGYNLPQATPRRRLRIALSIVAAVALVAGSAGLVIFRALSTDMKQAVLLVRGSSAWENTEARVDGVKLARTQSYPFTRTGNYMIYFFLEPGDYDLTVVRDGRSVYTSRVSLTLRDNQQTIQLPGEVPSPSTLPSNPFVVLPSSQ